MNQRARVRMTGDEISAFLNGQKKLQLATINRDGSPHLVTMFYGMVGGKLAFWTYRTSKKALNMARDPRITCLIEDGEDYFALRGVMMYGTARILTDQNEIRYVGVEVVRRMMNVGDDAIAPFVEQTAAKRNAYVVEPTDVASWDHRKLT